MIRSIERIEDDHRERAIDCFLVGAAGIHFTIYGAVLLFGFDYVVLQPSDLLYVIGSLFAAAIATVIGLGLIGWGLFRLVSPTRNRASKRSTCYKRNR